jgi:hypothetical protein
MNTNVLWNVTSCILYIVTNVTNKIAASDLRVAYRARFFGNLGSYQPNHTASHSNDRNSDIAVGTSNLNRDPMHMLVNIITQKFAMIYYLALHKIMYSQDCSKTTLEGNSVIGAHFKRCTKIAIKGNGYKFVISPFPFVGAIRRVKEPNIPVRT